MQKIIVSSALCIILIACQKDVQPAIDRTNFGDGLDRVDHRIVDLFKLFEKEAEARGVSIDFSTLNISGEIKEIAKNHVAGYCRWGGNRQEVVLDKEIYDTDNPVLIEAVVFHELGHCVLNRQHKEGVLEGNVCESLMNSGTGSCFTPYSRQRKYYLDELFSKLNDN